MSEHLCIWVLFTHCYTSYRQHKLWKTTHSSQSSLRLATTANTLVYLLWLQLHMQGKKKWEVHTAQLKPQQIIQYNTLGCDWGGSRVLWQCCVVLNLHTSVRSVSASPSAQTLSPTRPYRSVSSALLLLCPSAPLEHLLTLLPHVPIPRQCRLQMVQPGPDLDYH